MLIKLKLGARPINANRYGLGLRWYQLLAGQTIEVQAMPKDLEKHVEIVEESEAENGSE